MVKKIKCVDCDEEATEICDLCGEYYCTDCAQSRQGYCDCETPPSIFPIKKSIKSKR